MIYEEQSHLDIKESAGSILSGPEMIISVNIASRFVSPVAGDGDRDGESVREPGDEIELILLTIV